MTPNQAMQELLDTAIQNLGPAKIDSPLKSKRFTAEDPPVRIQLTKEDVPEIEGDLTVAFEPAGPREKIYFDPNKCKAAVVTCGGLCPGLNDVVRAITLEAHYNYGVASVLGVRFGLEGFIPSYGHEIVELTPHYVSTISEFGGTVLGSSRGPQPVADIVDCLERLNVSMLFVIGGDGTMKAARAIQDEANSRGTRIAIIGVPKTIDNDISGVNPSFGFDTAVDVAGMVIRCAHVEATGAKNGVGMVKLMGRESGFIAAQATLAFQDVNFVLVPEQEFALGGDNGLLPALEKRLAERAHAVIVVAEGAGQHLLQASGQTDASGNVMLGDICDLLQKEIKGHFTAKGLPLTLKFIDPSYTIRSAPANSNDCVYCNFLGRYAVHAAMAGKTGMCVSKVQGRFVHMPFHLVTRRRRKLDTSSEYWRAVVESTGQYAVSSVG